ncbi:MAG: Glycine cleavage system protein [Planctomycetota bacterium]|jgi:glycine cleavage system H protein
MKPVELRFARTHEWVSLDGFIATIGISDFAVKLVECPISLVLPQHGQLVVRGDRIAELEGEKAVTDVYSPFSGQITEVNSDLPDQLDLFSSSPFEKAWIVRLRIASASESARLMSHAEYLRFCSQELR